MSATKAYKNLDFLTSRDARSIRILSEYLEPQSRFERYKVSDTVVFFGSARALPFEDAQAQSEQAEASGDAARIARARSQLNLARYYDDARKLAVACAGSDIDDLVKGGVAFKKTGTVTLRSPKERMKQTVEAKTLDPKAGTMIDQLWGILAIAESSGLAEFEAEVS